MGENGRINNAPAERKTLPCQYVQGILNTPLYKLYSVYETLCPIDCTTCTEQFVLQVVQYTVYGVR